MSLIDLSTEEMLAVTGAWIDPKQTRSVLTETPTLSPFLPTIESAHLGLLSAESDGDDLGEEYTSLRRTLTEEYDPLHDRTVRAIDHRMQAEIELASDPEASRWREAHARVLTRGTSINKASFLAEAGHAQLIVKTLADDPDLANELKTLSFSDGRTLYKVCLDLGKLGEKMARAEERSTAIAAEAAAEKKATRAAGGGAELRKARNRWMQVVALVRSNLDLLHSEETALRARLLAPLEKAEGRVVRAPAVRVEAGAEKALPSAPKP